MQLLVFITGVFMIFSGAWMITKGIKAQGEIDIHLKEIAGGSIKTGSAGLLMAFLGFWLIVVSFIFHHKEHKDEEPKKGKRKSKGFVLLIAALVLWAVTIICGTISHFAAADSSNGWGLLCAFFFFFAFGLSVASLAEWDIEHNNSKE